MKPYIRVCAEINLDAAAYNFKSMKENLAEGTKIIAVVKTDGYGHGALPIARMAEAYEYIWGFAVATAEEAFLLRRFGIQKPVLLLGFAFLDACEEIVRQDIRPAVFTLPAARQYSKEAARQGKTVRLHIKVDTGMSRIGFRDDKESADAVKEISLLPNVELEGLFTHFARADEADKTDARQQLSRYQAFCRKEAWKSGFTTSPTARESLIFRKRIWMQSGQASPSTACIRPERLTSWLCRSLR